MSVSEFQRKCDVFVSREVRAVQNAAVEAFKKADEFYENSTNVLTYVCPHCEEALPDDVPAASEDHSAWCYQCPMCSKPFDDAEMNDKEVLEWWAVSEYLADKLQARGEVIYDGEDCKIWGRCTPGKTISTDSVIEDIVKEMSA